MNPKEYLLQIRLLNARIKNIENSIERIREEEHEALQSSWPDGEPHGTKTGDPVAAKVIRLIDTLQRYENILLGLKSELWHKKMEIIETISGVPSAECNRILYLRYVECKTWEEIAVDIGYTWRHTIRLHGDALKMVGEILDKR